MAAGINCGKCGSILEENTEVCPSCGLRKKCYSVTAEVKVCLDVGMKMSNKREGSGELHEQVSRRKPSVNPNFPRRVREDRSIDRIKGTYDPVVTDVATGEGIHEEHTTLKKHTEDKTESPVSDVYNIDKQTYAWNGKHPDIRSMVMTT